MTSLLLTITFPASGNIARVAVESRQWYTLDGIPVVTNHYGEVEGIPPAGSERFLVSAMVLAALPPEYEDWAFAPDTGSTAIRNEKGQIEAVTRLVTVTV